MEQLAAALPLYLMVELGPKLLLLAIGALAGHLWTRFRSRRIALRWSQEHQSIAVSGEDVRFGKVEVRFNGQTVTNLYAGVVKLENESVTDLTDVVVNIAYADGTVVLVSHANLEGSLQMLPFTDTFERALVQRQPADLPYLTTRRDYRIPVFNRGARAVFVLLLRRDATNPPTGQVAVDHKGVRLRQRPAAVMYFGIPFPIARNVGLAITFAAAAAIAWWGGARWGVTLVTWLLAVLLVPIGAALIRLGRTLIRLLS